MPENWCRTSTCSTQGNLALPTLLTDHTTQTTLQSLQEFFFFLEGRYYYISVLSQMVTYLFVIEELGVVSTSRAYKAKIRRITKDVVKSEV